MADNDWKKRLGVVFSTNPDFNYEEEAEQEPEVQTQLEEIRKEYAALNPEDLSFIDPCLGSGHIVCYAFDVLMQIYESYGYGSTH